MEQTIGATQLGAGDAPLGVAVITTIGMHILLQASNRAFGAFAALVEPVAVGVQAVLDMVEVNQMAVFFAEFGGFIPSGGFHLNQFKVGLVTGVVEQGVAHLV